MPLTPADLELAERKAWLATAWKVAERRGTTGEVILEFGLEVWAACVVAVAMGEWAMRCDERHRSGYGYRDPSKPSCNMHEDCADNDRILIEITGRSGSHCYKPGCRLCR